MLKKSPGFMSLIISIFLISKQWDRRVRYDQFKCVVIDLLPWIYSPSPCSAGQVKLNS